MTNILDEIDIIKNIANIYDNNTSFSILKDMERVLDELDLYVYDNWKDGEIVSGPTISRHWVSIKVSWPRKSMPDPMGGKRLLDYDCQLSYQKSHVVRPKQIKKPSDIRPGTKKGILERLPIWIVEIKMPIKLLSDMYSSTLATQDKAEEEVEDKQMQVQDQMQAEQPVDDLDAGGIEGAEL